MATTGLYRIYIGDIDDKVTSDDLAVVWREAELEEPLRILVKTRKFDSSRFAFIDCSEKDSYERGIELLNGLELKGSKMQAQPAAISRRKQATKLLIRNVPSGLTTIQIEQLINAYGQVQRCDIVTSAIDVSVYVTYESPDQAQMAYQGINNFEFYGSILKVDIGTRAAEGPPVFEVEADHGPLAVPISPKSGIPVRMLVPAPYIGAVIGRKGVTIREITTNCRARIDVRRESTPGISDKVIAIYGEPENCTSAVKNILEVIELEMDEAQRGDLQLKLLAEDRFCGRVIGRGGHFIKNLRAETDTRVTVSNYQEVPAILPDRVIAVKGTVEGMCKAEGKISEKLRECYSLAAASEPAGPTPMFQGVPPPMQLPLMPNNNIPGPRLGPAHFGYAAPPGMGYGAGMVGPGGAMMPLGPPNRRPLPVSLINIHVPSSSVGCLIGSQGSHVKRMIRESCAFIFVNSQRDDPQVEPLPEKTVTVRGTPEARWKASLMIAEKLQKEGFMDEGEFHLKTSVIIPRELVGRIIGRQGKTVRLLQTMTGANIKIPTASDQGEEVAVVMCGNLVHVHLAQNKIIEIALASGIEVGTPMGSPTHLAAIVGGGAELRQVGPPLPGTEGLAEGEPQPGTEAVPCAGAEAPAGAAGEGMPGAAVKVIPDEPVSATAELLPDTAEPLPDTAEPLPAAAAEPLPATAETLPATAEPEPLPAAAKPLPAAAEPQADATDPQPEAQQEVSANVGNDVAAAETQE